MLLSVVIILVLLYNNQSKIKKIDNRLKEIIHFRIWTLSLLPVGTLWLGLI